jgi:hypothetical protein
MNWINDGFTPEAWEALRQTIRTKDFTTEYSDVFGQFKCGALCFDLVLREYDGKLILDADAYELGVNNGYGYTNDGAPYTEAGGIALAIDTRMKYQTVLNTIIKQLDDAVNNDLIWKEYASNTELTWEGR